MNLITDTKKLNSAIESIKTAGTKLDAMVHNTGLSVMAHVAEHRNTTLIKQLYDALPRSARRKSLILWFESNMPVQITEKRDGSIAVEIADLDDALWMDFKANLDTRLVGADKVPYWEIKNAPNVQHAPTLEDVLKYIGKKANDQKCTAEEKAKLVKLIKLAETIH